MKRSLVTRFALGAALAVMLTACGPPWRVIKKSGPPSELKGVTAMEVEFDYSQVLLGGKSEEQWLKSQPPEDRKKYKDVKQTANDAFFSRLRSELPGVEIKRAPAEMPVTLKVEYTLLEQGKYAVVFAMDSRLESNLAFSKNGQVTDKIHVKTAVDATVTQPSIHQRMGKAGRRIADLAVQYFRQAQKAKGQ